MISRKESIKVFILADAIGWGLSSVQAFVKEKYHEDRVRDLTRAQFLDFCMLLKEGIIPTSKHGLHHISETPELIFADSTKYFTVVEAAAELGSTDVSVRNWITQGKLPGCKFKGVLLVQKYDVAKMKEGVEFRKTRARLKSSRVPLLASTQGISQRS